MSATANRFVRRTSLQEDEYRKNFRQIDRDVIEVLKSAEAKRVTHLMGTVYLTLIDAPSEYWEREGVLRFAGEAREGKSYTAWQQLVGLLDCGNSTAKKALEWMHQQGIIGYFAGKNGVGIRIFINRAAASIGRRGDQKNLRLVRTPASETRTPTTGIPFKVCNLDIQDLDKEVRAPKNGADTKTDVSAPSAPTPVLDGQVPPPVQCEGCEVKVHTSSLGIASIDEVVERLKGELEPCVKAAARQAASQAAACEVERTREWFEMKALPKAIRVAQHETFDLLRKHSTIDERERRARADLQVGRAMNEYTPPTARPLTPEEIAETAATCIALLEAQGKKIDVTLAEISSEAGGWLLPEDASRVRNAAEALMQARGERR